jgi:hypothetical protein
VNRSDASVWVERSGVHKTEIDSHAILNVVRATPGRVATTSDRELSVLARSIRDERRDRLRDVLSTEWLNDTVWGQLGTDRPV